jgi:hypothetical protein|tara:strand:+ start:250 stop:453 length:204 start_codon:yes stop_codon:yes gene_type:complete
MNLKEEFKLKPIPKSKQGNRRKATRNLKRASQYKDVNKILHNANRSALDSTWGKLYYPNVFKKGSIY